MVHDIILKHMNPYESKDKINHSIARHINTQNISFYSLAWIQRRKMVLTHT